MQPTIIYFALVLARVGTGVMMFPLFGGRGTPRIIRIGWTLSLAAFWFGALDASPDPKVLEKLGGVSWVVCALAMLREAALGAVVGFLFNLFTVPARVAGEFITSEMGVSLAAVQGPAGDRPAGSITLIFETLNGLVLLGLDLHHIFLAALHASFARHPLGGLPEAIPPAPLLAGAARAEELGLLMGGPIALCLFLLIVALALMTRAAPQLNIYSVGFSLQTAVGILAALFLRPELLSAMTASLAQMSQLLQSAL
jgi:flagellar biosynthetic protein FliR